jgi:hypothetical protein
MVAPAPSTRVTTVASRRGMNPSTVADPFIMGSPATSMLSLMATRRPASGPSPVRSSVVTYQAPSSLSASAGHRYGRSGISGAFSWYMRSTAS